MTTARPLASLLRHAQIAAPEDVLSTLARGGSMLHASGLELYLVDYEHSVLRPTTGSAHPTASLEGTMAGRCWTTQTLLEAPAPDGGLSVWVPVTERAERLGVLALTVPSLDDADRGLAVELGLLAALLVRSGSAYSDRFHLQRRRADLTLAAEMQWSLLPPLTFSHEGTTVTGLLEPAYEVGGDCFDYALNGHVLSLAVFDAMGHGLPSSVLSGLAVGAYRHARRTQVPLAEAFAVMDEAVAGLMGDTFVTAVAGELDLRTGMLSWTSAGHPTPVVVRDGSVLSPDAPAPALPIGFGLVAERVAPQRLALQPGDRVLLYTDGAVEARSPDGEEFGLERLADVLVRESASGLLASEVLRRVVRACLDFQGGRLRDDATLLLLEWDGPTVRV